MGIEIFKKQCEIFQMK